MKEIINKETITSVEIAKITGKKHYQVMRDIRELKENVENLGDYKFVLSKYITVQNKEQPLYVLTKKESLLLASGYNPILRAKIIDRWEELENQVSLPQNYKEALQHLIVQVEKNEQLQLDNKKMKPKADYFDELVDRNLLTNFTETSKELKIKRRDLINTLIEKKFLYRNKKGTLVPYAKKNKGYFEVKESFRTDSDWAGVQTFVTPKGKEMIMKLL